MTMSFAQNKAGLLQKQILKKVICIGVSSLKAGVSNAVCQNQ